MSSRRLPFQGLTPKAWQNLGLSATGVYYFLWFLMPLTQHLLFLALASDYLAFWSAGYIANQQGYPQVYDLQTLTEVQKPLVPNPDPETLVFSPLPAPYLPVFLLPFRLLARLPLQVSFWVWDILNLIVAIAYLIHLGRRFAPLSQIKRPILFLLFSFAVFSNFFWGQLDVWLMICVGEFFWNLHRGRPFPAGLWLGGMLLKPQLLILVVPFLLVRRAWRVLGGFALAGGAVGAASAALLGKEGIVNFLQMSRFWGKSEGTLAAINPANMMNWRMVWEHLHRWTGAEVALGVALAGTLVMLGVELHSWFSRQTGEDDWLTPLLGIFATTLLVTWHAHYHMAMVLLPLLLVALLTGCLAFRFVLWWVFLPPLVQFLSFVGGVLSHPGAIHPYTGLNSFLTGSAMMGTTALFLFRRPEMQKRCRAGMV